MKRKNLIIDEILLKKVIQLFGINNYSQAVNKSMEEVIKIYKMREIINYHGQNIWDGNLSQMREDKKKPEKKTSKKGK
ncbi:MAG: type II toxin-antitoxin system VapB family antitoxin [Oligoflexia bacterium]|nr:type II toxin-antitoxin system VapB family antitoxin [Oligoflexia bacterium]